MWGRMKCTETTGRNLWNAASLIEHIEKTRSFDHIVGEVLRGWFMGRAKIHEFGQHRREHYETPYYSDESCGKCKGRGWFGRGRPTCDECDGIGRTAKFNQGKWRGNNKVSGTSKRRWMYIVDLSFDRGRERNYLKVFHDAMERTVEFQPEWIDDITIGGERSRAEKKEIIDEIIGATTKDCRRPSVRVPNKIDERVAWSGMRPDKIPGFDRGECLVRLALTFGCTCPVTGEFISPKGVIREIVPWNEEQESRISPLGFRENVYIDNWRTGYKTKFSVSPLSEAGENSISRAVRKWSRSNPGEVVNEWVLAEVMKNQILKRAA